uniref:Uncharacterized protein n=1 Tax=Mycena chlorophos TaxID=658473 RepID=A0ABQ0LSS8_MYCCL|nr:predicted protein [Mycena chlorophos]
MRRPQVPGHSSHFDANGVTWSRKQRTWAASSYRRAKGKRPRKAPNAAPATRRSFALRYLRVLGYDAFRLDCGCVRGCTTSLSRSSRESESTPGDELKVSEVTSKFPALAARHATKRLCRDECRGALDWRRFGATRDASRGEEEAFGEVHDNGNF